MNAVAEVIEGTWEKISRQSDKLNGHRLRVLILRDTGDTTIERRLQALNDWIKMPRPLGPALLDDSRAAIYGEEADRG